MPIRLEQIPTSPSSSDPPRLRTYRYATSYLVGSELTKLEEPTAPTSPLAGSPTSSTCAPPSSSSRFRTPTRCRLRSDRTPSPPRPCTNSKAPRSVSPGGTPSASAVESRKLSRRGVTWAPVLVASMRTRPRTLPGDVPLLYYSRADERRFRREADEERCQLDEDTQDRSWTEQPGGDHQPLWSSESKVKDYAISKAVVIFGETTRTYGLGTAAPDQDTAFSSTCPSPRGVLNFDDDAFWNGQLTWS